MRSEPVLNEEEWTKLSEAVVSVKAGVRLGFL
jgi:hypothetical protein